MRALERRASVRARRGVRWTPAGGRPPVDARRLVDIQNNHTKGDGASMAEQWRRDDYLLTTDPDAIDAGTVHAFLRQTRWARGIPLEVVQRALAHSLCFGLLGEQELVGFARVITDYATFAYVTDVFIVPAFRGQGLATWMMTCIVAHPELQDLRRWCLVTRDAHGVYARVGFERTAIPERWMERLDPRVYERAVQQQAP